MIGWVRSEDREGVQVGEGDPRARTTLRELPRPPRLLPTDQPTTEEGASEESASEDDCTRSQAAATSPMTSYLIRNKSTPVNPYSYVYII
jgi:hypothetical protein